ncbi:MAG: DUF58 domain-containing protein [Chitinophagales bacterium]|nr:DUF58 domain-containing protein [Chitinophagales bacterium]
MEFFRAIFLQKRLFAILAGLVVLFALSAAVKGLFVIAQVLFFVVLLVTLVETLMLFGKKSGIVGTRLTPERLSNGDENELNIYIENNFSFGVNLKVIDEIPHQFQRRDLSFFTTLSPGTNKKISYSLKPVERGEYSFGGVNVFATSVIGLVSRRFIFSADKMVPVYPSFLQMRKYELLAISNRLSDYGLKKIRRIGHSMEFEKIREYVQGDDYRTVNWKATARKNQLMVNQFQDEKSQHVYSIIDKSRLMKMPFEGMTLLDYSINAALVISNIALKKGDKPGLISFSEKINSLVPAESRATQMNKIQEALYREQTRFLDANFELLNATLVRKLQQRSLVLLYTNFESLQGMHRQLKYLKSIAARHVVVVIFFENTELKDLIKDAAPDTEGIYQKTIAEKFAFEKRQIVKELKQHGIYSILTPPQQLTVNTINKYLELKARDLI